MAQRIGRMKRFLSPCSLIRIPTHPIHIHSNSIAHSPSLSLFLSFLLILFAFLCLFCSSFNLPIRLHLTQIHSLTPTYTDIGTSYSNNIHHNTINIHITDTIISVAIITNIIRIDIILIIILIII